MEIVGRNPNPDKYSIKDIRIGYEPKRFRFAADGTEMTLVDLCLLVTLEPEPYRRNHFDYGSSYRAKKNPCTLRIELGELQEMQQVISRRLLETYQFLCDRDLLTELQNPKEEQASKEAVA